MAEQQRMNQEMAEQRSSSKSIPRGAIDVRTGQVFAPAAGGVVDPRDGAFHQSVGGGYINTRTGAFSPSIGPQ